MWDKNSKWFLENHEEEVVDKVEERDDKVMLDIALAIADVITEVDDGHDIFEGTWKEWNDADVVIDSAGFDEASFYSDDSASWDSEDKATGNGDGEDKATGDGDGEDDGIYDLYLEV